MKLFENLKYVVIDAEMATALTGKAVEWIRESGAQRGDRYLRGLEGALAAGQFLR